MLDILYRDDCLVAIDKPSGLLVHRSDVDRHETRFALQLLRDQIGQKVYPLHRLDKATSGVLLFALDPASAHQAGLQFERNEIRKRYLAVVRGWPAESGVIDHPLAPKYDQHGRRYGAAHLPPARPALTEFRRLASVELPVALDRHATSRYALVMLTPQTGRRHQLRRHLKHIAHPIIGDTSWGKGVHNRFFEQRFGCRRLLLAATRIELRHPRHGGLLTIVAPPAPSFAAVLEALGWQRAAAMTQEC